MKLPVITTPIQVRYSDTDGMGHLSNEIYVTYMAVGRVTFFEEVEKLTGILLPSVVVNVNLDYLKECFYGDKVEVVTYCNRIGNKSITTCNEIYASGNLVARGSATNVGFNPETRETEAIPADWEPSDYTPAD